MAPRAAIATPPAADWIDSAERALRAAGHRASSPRAAVLALIGEQDCVLSAREIADELRDGGNPVGVATVYRTLELLESMRLVQRLDVGDGSARYEPALPGGELWADTLGPEGSDAATYAGSLEANTKTLVAGFSDGAIDCRFGSR